MNALTPIFNRSDRLPDDNWFHIVPRGEFPHVDEAKRRRMQILDDAALKAMANSFKPKVLIDQEHFSYSPGKSSEAFGWLVAVENRADGLWGQIEWTDLGEAAIKNRRYRFLSPVWMARDIEKLTEDRVRPLRLDSIGLTNTPNLTGMIPLTNRDSQHPSGEGRAETGQHQQTRSNTMKNIATKLGLSAEASEDAIVAEVTKLQNRATSAESQVSALTEENGELKNRVAEQDNEQIDAELDARGVEETKRTRLKPVLVAMKNREERVAFLDDVVGEAESKEGGDETTAPSGKPALMKNRAATPHPGKSTGNGGITPQKLNAEVRAIMNRDGIKDYTTGYNLLRSEKPELFGTRN